MSVFNNQLMMPTVSRYKLESFDDVYTSIITNVLEMIGARPEALASKMNERTGVVCHTLTQGIGFTIDVGDKMPTSMLRKFYYKTAAAEAAWFMMGTQDSTWIRKHCSIWEKFTEDDGVTIRGAYGYRWRKHFGRDQIADLIEALLINPTDRRTVVCAWDPGDDGLMHHGTKNVPCPFSMTFNIVGGKLIMSYFIRSSDLFVGLPYDIFCTAFVMDMICSSIATRAQQLLMTERNLSAADSLKYSQLATLKCGTMSTFIANPHMYDNHVELAKEAIHARYSAVKTAKAQYRQLGLETTFAMPHWSVSAVTYKPDAYVQLVQDLEGQMHKPALAQRPEVAL